MVTAYTHPKFQFISLMRDYIPKLSERQKTSRKDMVIQLMDLETKYKKKRKILKT